MFKMCCICSDRLIAENACVFVCVNLYNCGCVCKWPVCGQIHWADLGPWLLLAFSMSVKKQLEAKPTPVQLRSSALPAATDSRTFHGPASPCQQVLARHSCPDLHTWPTKSPESPLLSLCDEQVIYNPSVCVFLRAMGPGKENTMAEDLLCVALIKQSWGPKPCRIAALELVQTCTVENPHRRIFSNKLHYKYGARYSNQHPLYFFQVILLLQPIKSLTQGNLINTHQCLTICNMSRT